MIGISSCLCGINCKYNGENNLNPIFLEMLNKGEAVPICPEQLGGLSTPRVPAEIQKDKEGKIQVITKNNTNVTKEYFLGAERALKILKALEIDTVILKSKSPSCGYGKIYDGTFSKTLIEGNGITVDLFLKNNIKVIDNEEYIKNK
ncbi:DUF523 domain-containing protein [Fusobacterium perfoetens]|uniref:DUF523 domain-containing protein n=1 Tax=Fusobacterium perfoetens TaxID=852 RepID=UPI0004863CD4|nr:DUF523 domain-containing protein [Fusobacterium perfoetens]MCI6152318.1 DUF523 domain-containing protein [Fusobacterium perfoetens]MDY3238176.1 DUF523 domain-containing protein [Fusobacterium perfoetens]